MEEISDLQDLEVYAHEVERAVERGWYEAGAHPPVVFYTVESGGKYGRTTMPGQDLDSNAVKRIASHMLRDGALVVAVVENYLHDSGESLYLGLTLFAKIGQWTSRTVGPLGRDTAWKWQTGTCEPTPITPLDKLLAYIGDGG